MPDPIPTKASSNEERTKELSALATVLGHKFSDFTLLDLALTHSSYANEQGQTQDGTCHNERLEFLGDAVLELCVSNILYHRFPKLREGALTRIRSTLVSTTNFAETARKLGLDEMLKVGRGEELQGGRQRDSVLSDTFEAVIAAVYEDGGYEAAMGCVQSIFFTHWNTFTDTGVHKDHKTHLQELTQQLFRATPTYTLIKSSGPEHAKTFTIEVALPNGMTFSATGSSYKKAEQEAAGLALTELGKA